MKYCNDIMEGNEFNNFINDKIAPSVMLSGAQLRGEIVWRGEGVGGGWRAAKANRRQRKGQEPQEVGGVGGKSKATLPASEVLSRGKGAPPMRVVTDGG
jgi:hypothetical protein